MARQFNIDLVVIEDIEGIDMRDYPDFCDCYAISAYWKDTEIYLDDDELDILNMEHHDAVYERALDIVF